ncbi:hypothetical protein [Nostoc sp.]|uniref:hypothetical protein n=1 Tax=Nostoc sp. TaxID=1180 RepID=UPI002FFB190E
MTIIEPLKAIALGELGNHRRELCISSNAFQTYAEAMSADKTVKIGKETSCK